MGNAIGSSTEWVGEGVMQAFSMQLRSIERQLGHLANEFQQYARRQQPARASVTPARRSRPRPAARKQPASAHTATGTLPTEQAGKAKGKVKTAGAGVTS